LVPEAIRWNFTKFLVDRKGKVVARFGPSREPKTLASAIERLTEGWIASGEGFLERREAAIPAAARGLNHVTGALKVDVSNKMRLSSTIDRPEKAQDWPFFAPRARGSPLRLPCSVKRLC